MYVTMRFNVSTNSSTTCHFDRSTIFSQTTNWMVILVGLLATILNGVITKTSYDLNRVIQARAKSNRHATLRSLARSHSMTYFFVIQQSFAHTLLSSTLISQTLIMMYDQLNTGVVGAVICFSKETILLTCLYQLIYIVVERHWSLVFPLRSPTSTFSKRTVCSMWVLSVLLSIPDKTVLANMNITPRCTTVWLISLNRFSNHYFNVITVIPVVIATGACVATLHYLRAAHASKMFTYNKPIKALKSAMVLTRCDIIILLIYGIPLGFFTVCAYLPSGPSTIKTLRCSHLLLSSYSILYPGTVTWNYAPIQRRVKAVLRLNKRSTYRMEAKYVKDNCRPITLMQHRHYNAIVR